MGLFNRNNRENDERKVERFVDVGQLEGISVRKTSEGKVVTVTYTTSRNGPNASLSDAQVEGIKKAVRADKVIVRYRHWYD